MSNNINIFLISSPLQILASVIVRSQYLSDSQDINILFCEGNFYEKKIDYSQWSRVVFGKPVRPRVDKLAVNIRDNFRLIDEILSEFTPDTVHLYMSDFYWTFNNSAYKYLKNKFKNKFQVSLIDEGTVMYCRQNLAIRDSLKSLAKYSYLKLFGIPYSFLTKRNFENNNPLVKNLYVYHPNIIVGESRSRKLRPIDPSYAKAYINSHYPLTLERNQNQKKILFLSQTYTRHVSKKALDSVMLNMVNYFREEGYTEFFFKSHHLEEEWWLEYLEQQFNFKNISASLIGPVEAYAQNLKFDAIVSFSSSALANLKLFGYEGEVTSYGLDQFDQYRETKRMNANIRPVFRKCGVLLVG